jgi:uncharacterized protein
VHSKIKKLKKILKNLESVVVAYSGGLDSTFLLKEAVDTLGKDNVLAVIARSETYPYSEYREAVRGAKRIGAKCRVISTKELAIENFKMNPVNRCYYCKKELFRDLDEIRKKLSFEAVLDGTNYDDLKDVRYGRKAAKELGVRSPLLEAGIGKELIRKVSKRLKLKTWNKPSAACLASRIPFHNEITAEKLGRIDKAEALLHKMGLGQVRVRMHGDIARIELSQEDITLFLKKSTREKAVLGLKKLGFKYVALDLQGYRTGSMHESA